jgi:hypothetical protein
MRQRAKARDKRSATWSSTIQRKRYKSGHHSGLIVPWTRQEQRWQEGAAIRPSEVASGQVLGHHQSEENGRPTLTEATANARAWIEWGKWEQSNEDNQQSVHLHGSIRGRFLSWGAFTRVFGAWLGRRLKGLGLSNGGRWRNRHITIFRDSY